MEPVYDAVWPTPPRGTQARRPAARLDDLRGKRIGFAWDYVFRGDELFPVLARELQRRFDGLEIVDYGTFGNLHGPHDRQLVGALPAALATHRVDGVVSGNGC